MGHCLATSIGSPPSHEHALPQTISREGTVMERVGARKWLAVGEYLSHLRSESYVGLLLGLDWENAVLQME